MFYYNYIKQKETSFKKPNKFKLHRRQENIVGSNTN